MVVVIMANLLVMLVCGTIIAVYALIVRNPLRIADFSRRVALSLVLGSPSPVLTCAILYLLSHRLNRRKSRSDVALIA